VPEGGIHGFRNESGESASMLLLFTPGAPGGLLRDHRRRAAVGEQDRVECFLRHDTFWVEGA
jgi:hypothetical protein